MNVFKKQRFNGFSEVVVDQPQLDLEFVSSKAVGHLNNNRVTERMGLAKHLQHEIEAVGDEARPGEREDPSIDDP
jgi:hypothetical protein